MLQASRTFLNPLGPPKPSGKLKFGDLNLETLYSKTLHNRTGPNNEYRGGPGGPGRGFEGPGGGFSKF